MNYAKKNLLFFTIYLSIGIIATLTAIFHNFPDNYKQGIVSGIAGGFIVPGILGIIITLKLIKNPKKAVQVEIAKTEERTQLIGLKSKSSTYTVVLYCESIATLITGFLGYREASITIAIVLSVQVLLYIGFLCSYSKKY
ncbi:MAG: hypothetical protein ABF633_10380 [Clostridium sp.]|uniref:hypothetical protein n=1 Tax=Clostridium sp. TaxID=1506 RepID=UPI0039ECB8EC